MKVKIIDFGGKLPTRVHYNDAGADVYNSERTFVERGEVVKIPLGFGLELPDGMVGFIFPRSSLSAQGLVCELPPIDAGYRGEIHAIVSNVGNRQHILEKDQRIGQLVVLPVITPDFVTELGEARECGTFGSSGR
jgi:dUTP pyrophosphatase